MNNIFDLKFWQRDYIKRFQLDRDAKEILNWFVLSSPQNAEEFIKDKYAREVYRGDIIDTYCSKYDIKKINKLLQDLDEELLTKDEIIDYEIPEQQEEFEWFFRGRIASRTLKRNGMKELAEKMCKKITSETKSYDEALCIIDEYVEITSREEIEEYEY